MRNSDNEEAIVHYTKGLNLGRDNGRLRRSMGAAYLNIGDIKNAVQNWQVALEFNPYDRESRRLLEKYSQK